MKKLFALLCALLLTVGLALPAAADDQRVFDEMGLLSLQQMLELENAARDARETTGLDWAILFTEDAGGRDSRTLAEDFYVEMGFGTGSDWSGSLFLVDFENGEIYVATCGKAIDYITDARREDMLDQCFELVLNEDYAGAAACYLEMGAAFVAQGVPEDHFRQDEETGEITEYDKPLGIGTVLLFAVVSAVIALVFRLGVSRGYSIKASAYVYPFMSQSNFALTDKNDLFQNRFVSSRVIPRSNNNGGGGGFSGSGRSGGSRTHVGGGGRTFGGGGRKFR